ncbi:hypothetical protein EYC84_004301 [Monilinia fructicola]|uniref:Uncharacterized protein n=1 Tax=Monilinia fructicola TaxID=38448 RepID=A0A5M9K2P5_MONFR|nr:hypothetical protein EYC84_004301 [Monilinia fructicola]
MHYNQHQAPTQPNPQIPTTKRGTSTPKHHSSLRPTQQKTPPHPTLSRNETPNPIQSNPIRQRSTNQHTGAHQPGPKPPLELQRSTLDSSSPFSITSTSPLIEHILRSRAVPQLHS